MGDLLTQLYQEHCNGNDLAGAAQKEIERLTAENKDLHAQVAALESKEVCNVAHDDSVIEGCPWCKIERSQAEAKEWKIRAVSFHHAEMLQAKIQGLEAQLAAETRKWFEAGWNMYADNGLTMRLADEREKAYQHERKISQ